MLNKTLDHPYYMQQSTKIAKEEPMELFFAPLACSMSARIALAEAGAAIDLVEVDTHAGRTLTTGEDYRAINPLGYVPALRLDDGTVLTENSAILQYIAEQYPGSARAAALRSHRESEASPMAELHQRRTA
jgi:glutathione S-transferase